MNKIISLILISISLLIFSCETDTDIGKDILPKDDLLDLNIIDTISINVHTLSMDTIRTDGVATFLLGEYIDPIFGQTKASFACDYDIVEYATFTYDYIIDSAEIILVADTFDLNHYGNIFNTQEITVYELTNALSDTVKHFGNDNSSQYMTGDIIGIKSFLPELNSDGKIKDRLVIIKLNNSFAQKFSALVSLGDDQTDDFKTFFKGVYITSENNGAGGVFYKYKLNSESLIKVYTHKGTVVNVFKISANTSNTIRFNLFEQDYSTTSFYSNIDNENVDQDTVAYIQAMGGLMAKITLPHIKKLKGLGSIVINRAELIVNTAPTSVSFEEDYAALDQMILTGYSPENEYYFLPEYISGSSYKSVSYNDGSYSFDIAGYIRDILDGVVENDGLLLFAGSGATSMKRSVITTGIHSNKMKLIISYSKL